MHFLLNKTSDTKFNFYNLVHFLAMENDFENVKSRRFISRGKDFSSQVTDPKQSSARGRKNGHFPGTQPVISHSRTLREKVARALYSSILISSSQSFESEILQSRH